MQEDELQELYEKACSYVRAASGSLKSDDLLYFYARFKQVTVFICVMCAITGFIPLTDSSDPAFD